MFTNMQIHNNIRMLDAYAASSQSCALEVCPRGASEDFLPNSCLQRVSKTTKNVQISAEEQPHSQTPVSSPQQSLQRSTRCRNIEFSIFSHIFRKNSLFQCFLTAICVSFSSLRSYGRWLGKMGTWEWNQRWRADTGGDQRSWKIQLWKLV